MDSALYNNLLGKIKAFENNIVNLPCFGQQSKHDLIHIIDDTERFKLIINRKGHRNPDTLTIMLNSFSNKLPMIRFDVNGADHENPPHGTVVPTPHLHIFTDEYQDGCIALPLSEVNNSIVINEIKDSLEFFADYSNIRLENVIIEPTLF